MKKVNTDYKSLLNKTFEIALNYVESVNDRPIDNGTDKEMLRSNIDGPLPENGQEAVAVIEQLAKDIEPGLLTTSGPRLFGYAIGGSFPAAMAADMLNVAWDQNVPYFIASPGTSLAEETAAKWILELLGFSPDCGIGFVTGASEAINISLITARNEVLKRAGWDAGANGLRNSPKINIVVSDQIHSCIPRALWMIGIGNAEFKTIPTDDNLRIIPEEISKVLDTCEGPTIVCAQAGCIDSGAFDPFVELAEAVKNHENAWLHIDGAIGLWASASDELKHLTKGLELADSWDTDGHKWFNMPYDSGIVIVKNKAAIKQAMGGSHMGSYLDDAMAMTDRNAIDYGMQGSRRPRGVAIYAAIKSLGRKGIVEHLNKTVNLAKRMADTLAKEPGIEICNEVVNSRFSARFGTGTIEEIDELTDRVVHKVQKDGFCYPSTTGYKGKKTMLFSVLGWNTTEKDIDLSAEVIIRIYREELKNK